MQSFRVQRICRIPITNQKWGNLKFCALFIEKSIDRNPGGNPKGGKKNRLRRYQDIYIKVIYPILKFSALISLGLAICEFID